MKITHQNLKKGIVKVKIDSNEDLWYLSHIIDNDDIIQGKTIRKIKKSGSDERQSNVIKKPIFISLKVRKVEFSKTSDILRVSGTIIEGPDDVPKGSHHTFNIEENSEIKIIKDSWLSFQIDKLKEASKDKKPSILLVIFDREEANIALMRSHSYQILTHLKGKVSKKDSPEKIEGNFYKELIDHIQEYVKRYSLKHVILASPSFWKEELLKELKDDELRKKIIQATCSSVDKSAFNEVLKRDEVKVALQEERIASEIRIVENLLSEISKNELAVYGLKETRQAVDAGAVRDLLISNDLIMKKRQDDSYGELDYLMRSVDKMKGDIHIINSDHDGGKKLDGLGGIGGILRYRLNY
ncbi:MAG: mRNA surveillance protein pelota [Candidatus Woesearchaeota archaeon]